MTVCVAVKVYDCIVFAADSASSIISSDKPDETSLVYAHGNKVFNLYKGLPLTAMTCGMGNFGARSVSSLAKDLRRQLSRAEPDGGIARNAYTLTEVVQRSLEFFKTCYGALPERSETDSFEFWIAGYSANSDHGEVWKIAIVGGQFQDPELMAGEGDHANIMWGGQPEAINRLLRGYSNDIVPALIDAGLPEERIAPLTAHIASYTKTPLVLAPMPIQDAIALAEFLVYMTKMYVRFLPGADVVGGDTDVATVTKHEGFKWIRRKHFYDRALNVLENDHV